MAANLKSIITAAFKLHGLTLRSEASRYLVEVLTPVKAADCNEWLDKIIEIVQKQPLTSSLVDRSVCETAVQECNEEQDEESDKIFCVIDAFSVPRLTYSSDRKKFIPNSTLGLPEPSLHGEAADKARLFRDRYNVLHQRTMRHDLFTSPVIGAVPEESKKFHLKPIEYLLGSTVKQGEVIVLGMLTQLKEGKWYLEDLTGSVQINLTKADVTSCMTCQVIRSHAFWKYPSDSTCELWKIYKRIIKKQFPNLLKLAKLAMHMPLQIADCERGVSEQNTYTDKEQIKKFHTGLFTENCFVLAEGYYEDDIFHVSAFGFPPPEPAVSTRNFFGNVNFFGGPSNTCAKASAKLKQIELENEDAMFIFLSDVYLDQIKVMEKLKVLFTGYSEFPPTCFVFCGNFLSSPSGNNHAKLLKDCFRGLADLICEFPNLVQNSRFIFVPGPQDPGPSTILPRPAIPNSITEDIRHKVPLAAFTSNPCRIQYCTQEIVVLREDIVTKMCRNCVRFPEDGDIPTHFTKTLVCQGHLTPLPLHVCPVYWSYDCGLRLYPLPDLIVCADKYDPFHSTAVDSIVLNPGSFPRTEFSFKVYLPASRQIEDSKIDD